MLDKGAVWFGVSHGRKAEDFKDGISDPLVHGFELHTDGWATVEKEEDHYDFSEIDEYVALLKANHKKMALRLQCAGHHFQHFPKWLSEKYHVRSISAGYEFADFEQDTLTGYRILKGMLTKQPTEIISGSVSLKCEEQGCFFQTTELHITNEYDHTLGFDYFCLKEAVLKILVNGRMIWRQTLHTGEKSAVMLTIAKQHLENEPDIIFCLDSGSLVIDNVKVSEDKPTYAGCVLTFPNYFDPMFREKYKKFLCAVKEKYQDNDVVDTIVVGGFGRWDEVTLLSDPVAGDARDDLLVRQWRAYGYTDQKYIEHVRWCMDVHREIFKNTRKRLLVQTIAFRVPGDTLLVNWKVSNYAAQNGFDIKTNGLSERFSEWDNAENVFPYLANRYKETPVLTGLEEAAQIANPALGHLMGHPHSLVNRLLIDGIDYFWLYANDLFHPLVQNYIRYYNELAGNVLISRYFYIPSLYHLTIEKKGRAYDVPLYGEWMGILLKKSEKCVYQSIDGRPVVSTSPEQNELLFGLDDRQKYNGLFGSTLTIEYYDAKGCVFDVWSAYPDGSEQGCDRLLGTVICDGTETFQKVSFYDSKWTNDKRSGRNDIFYEVRVVPKGEIPVCVSYLELSVVPVKEFRRQPLTRFETVAGERILGSGYRWRIDARLADGADFFVLPVKELTDSYNCAQVQVFGLDERGNRHLLGEKQIFMPGSRCEVTVPLMTKMCGLTAYEISVTDEEGKSAMFFDKAEEPVCRFDIFSQSAESALEALPGQPLPYQASRPFQRISCDINTCLTLYKTLPDGQQICVYQGIGMVHCFEPQTDGIYHIHVDQPVNVCVWSLIRRTKPSPAKRHPSNGAKRGGPFCLKSGEDGYTGLMSHSPLRFFSKAPSDFMTGRHALHFILKNGTSASMVRLYWREAGKDYAEADSIVLPVAPNDPELREYVYDLSAYSQYTGMPSDYCLQLMWGFDAIGPVEIKDIYLMEYEDKLKVL